MPIVQPSISIWYKFTSSTLPAQKWLNHSCEQKNIYTYTYMTQPPTSYIWLCFKKRDRMRVWGWLMIDMFGYSLDHWNEWKVTKIVRNQILEQQWNEIKKRKWILESNLSTQLNYQVALLESVRLVELFSSKKLSEQFIWISQISLHQSEIPLWHYVTVC